MPNSDNFIDVLLNFFFRQCSVIIVIDLTEPYDMWNTFYTLVDNARIFVDNAMQQFVKKSSDNSDGFMADRKAAFKEHKVST